MAPKGVDDDDGFTVDPVKDRKKEADLSHVVDAELPPAVQLAKEGKLSEALELLLGLEKQTRNAADLQSIVRVVILILQLLHEAKDWALLNEYIVMLMKKRGQLKQAMTRLVQEAMTYLETTPSMEVKLTLIDTLRQVTEGKIFVEVERARLTRILAKIREDEGKIGEAADVLQQIQVETFGSMDKRERTDFLLEQMRLLLAKKDYVRTLLVSKKISPRFFDKDEVQDLKIRYYQLLIEYGDHEEKYLDVAKYYHHIYNTTTVKEGGGPWGANSLAVLLRAIILYVILAPYNNEQSDMLARMSLDANLEKIPATKAFLKRFTTPELIAWAEVDQHSRSEVFDNPIFKADERCAAVWKIIQDRVVEHNMHVVAKYYKRISLKRLAELVNLSATDTEAVLARLVVGKTIQGRVDRPDGFVSFVPRQDPNEVLNEWSSDLEALLQVVERTTHLITKEEMVNSILRNREAAA